MPAVYGNRRIEMSQMEAVGVAPAEVYSPTTRYAILALGVVVAVQTLPLNVAPLLTTGQTAVASATLRIGDRP